MELLETLLATSLSPAKTNPAQYIFLPLNHAHAAVAKVLSIFRAATLLSRNRSIGCSTR